MKRPLATLSLDLDNQWSYMKTHGDAGWETFPSYLDVAVPRILELLAEFDLRITFFVVGQDAALEKNHAALRQIAEAGHEIANHSFSHEPWFHRYTPAETEAEVARAEEAIEQATGVRPKGWRGPGFSFSPTLLEALKRRDYRYDASTFPTYLGPLARLYYFMTSGLNRDQKKERGGLYGSWKDGFRPLRPFKWNLAGGSLLEIPVSTIPVFRTPFHASYLQYLARFSPLAAKLYFAFALEMCRITRLQPSFLLHPTDFLGTEDAPVLASFPAMDLPAEVKLRRLRGFLAQFTARFQPIAMGDFAPHAHPRLSMPLPTSAHLTEPSST